MRFYFQAVFTFFFSSFSFALPTVGNLDQTSRLREFQQESKVDFQKEADLERQAVRFVRRDPFVPQKGDYGFQLGSMWLKNNLYLIGGNIGAHLGTCIFVETETCQQYIDGLWESTGRDAYTYTSLAASLRWQYVNFPSTWSPLLRVFVGGRHSMTPDGTSTIGAAGIGIGMTTYLHPRADLRFEIRVGQADQTYAQALFSLQFKIDRWVEYFGKRLKDIGIGTVDATGTVIKTGIGVTGSAVETLIKRSGEAVGVGGSKTPTPTPAPVPAK